MRRRGELMARDAFARWTAARKRVTELKNLMHSFRDVKAEGMSYNLTNTLY
jgi:hypothetical protein